MKIIYILIESASCFQYWADIGSFRKEMNCIEQINLLNIIRVHINLIADFVC